MTEALKGVVSPRGTAALAKVPSFSEAGKTGTAEKIDPKGGYMPGKYIVSFCGFLPTENPAFVGLVMLDDAQVKPDLNYGGTVAGPIFARIGERVARYMNLEPEPEAPTSNVIITQRERSTIKDRMLLKYLHQERCQRPSVRGSQDAEITGVAYDSRKVKPGWLFVALRGEKVDGHAYVEQAIAPGAVAVLGEKMDADARVTTINVADARAALAEVAAAFYQHPAQRLKMIGVTGTNGKTTTAFLIKHICEKEMTRCGLLGTVRYEMGDRILPASRTTPEALDVQDLLARMREAGCKAAVMEVSSHALMQERVRQIEWDCAVFTNLTQDHLDYHGTMEKYFEAKSLLFTAPVGAEEEGRRGHQPGRPLRREADREMRSAGADLRRGRARGFSREQHQDRFRRDLVPARGEGQDLPRAAAAHRAVQCLQLPRGHRRGLRHRHRRPHFHHRAGECARRARPAGGGAGAAAVPHLRRLRAHGRRAAERDENAARAFAEPAHRRLRLRRKSRQGQAAQDGRGGRSTGRLEHHHLRQSAQGRPGRDHRGYPERLSAATITK